MNSRFLNIPAIFIPYQNRSSSHGGMEVWYLRVQSDTGSSQQVQRRIVAALRSLYGAGKLTFPNPYTLPMWQGSWSDQFGNSDRALLSRIQGMSLFLAVIGVFCVLVMAFGILSLLSADTQGRMKEMGLRRALGSTRNRAIATLAGESAVILVLANVVGGAVMLAFIGRLLDAVKPLLAGGGDISQVIFSAGPVVLGFVVSLAASILAGGLASLYPAWSAGRVAPADALRET
jgi:ABC-type antimicrobial peptide transport system permease subunit